MGKKDAAAGAQPLEWTVSPWRTNWKRPAGALAMCIVLAFLAGFSVNYPNYSSTPDQAGAGTTVVDEAGAAGDAGVAADVEEEAAYRANWVGRAVIWSLFGLALLLGMTASIYLPVRCRLDEKGVTTFFLWVPTTRPWGHYRNYYVHDTGVHLTTMPEPSALDPFRGHYIQFAGNRDAVVAYIGAMIKRPEQPKTGDGKK